jgi:hypothetical protein
MNAAIPTKYRHNGGYATMSETQFPIDSPARLAFTAPVCLGTLRKHAEAVIKAGPSEEADMARLMLAGEHRLQTYFGYRISEARALRAMGKRGRA